jgi:undecaprenyl-diphosphatase
VIQLDPGASAALAANGACPAHMTYTEAGVVGLIQGVSELFPVSSLGHNVLIPALVGGCWAQNLNVSAPESPYLAFIVGMHVATAVALIGYFWRDWLRIVGGFFSSLGHLLRPAQGTARWQLRDADEKLAWMIIFATIPVGVVGLFAEHFFRVLFGHAVWAAVFLMVNGLILLAAERRYRGGARAAEPVRGERGAQDQPQPGGPAAVPAAGPAAGTAVAEAVRADRRLAAEGYWRGTVIGAAQIAALLAGISRDGVVMATGMFRGLSRQDAARFSFLLSAPVILAAGVLKIPDLLGPLGDGVRGQILFGSVLAGIGGWVSVRYLVRYFRTSTLTPFAVYCLLLGLGSIVYLELIR